jgi:cell pole-organizing protein PopZ
MIMGDLSNEPSMEEILASIRRIISEEGEAAVPTPRARPARAPRAQPTETEEEVVGEASEPQDDSADILELTAPMAVDAPAEDALLSEEAAAATSRSLAALAMSVTQPGADGHSKIEDLVRELLRPMLKEWLDANLPAIVDAKVAAEIARVTGRR